MLLLLALETEIYPKSKYDIVPRFLKCHKASTTHGPLSKGKGNQ